MDDEDLRGIIGSPLDDALGFFYAGLEGDTVVCRLAPTQLALGVIDPPVLHGGTLATCVDTAGWYAVVRASDSQSWVAVDLRIDYLRPAALDPLRIEAACLRAGRTLAVADVRVARENAPDRLLAVGRATFARVP